MIVVNALSEPAISRRVSAEFSRASSEWEQRGHEHWTRKRYSETTAGLAAPEPGGPRGCSSDRKRSSETAGLAEPEPGGPGLSSLPEESPPEAPPTREPPEASAEQSTATASGFSGAYVPLQPGDKTLNVIAAERLKKHPLWELQGRVAKEIANADYDAPAEVYDVFLAGSRKEFQWSKLDEKHRDETPSKRRPRTSGQNSKWVDNEAFEPIPPREAARIRAELAREGGLDDTLVPRFVLTDKNSPLSTKENSLPLKANARLVVPGYRDRTYLARQLQTDAPTASRTAFFLLLSIVSFHTDWALLCGDVGSAFLKCDPYMGQTRRLFMGIPNAKTNPRYPLKTARCFVSEKAFLGWQMHLASGTGDW